jgi:hypothetical protein
MRSRATHIGCRCKAPVARSHTTDNNAAGDMDADTHCQQRNNILRNSSNHNDHNRPMTLTIQKTPHTHARVCKNGASHRIDEVPGGHGTVDVNEGSPQKKPDGHGIGMKLPVNNAAIESLKHRQSTQDKANRTERAMQNSIPVGHTKPRGHGAQLGNLPLNPSGQSVMVLKGTDWRMR